MGGTIELASKSGQGSTFSFTFLFDVAPGQGAAIVQPLYTERRAILLGLPPLTAAAPADLFAAHGIPTDRADSVAAAADLLGARRGEGWEVVCVGARLLSSEPAVATALLGTRPLARPTAA